MTLFRSLLFICASALLLFTKMDASAQTSRPEFKFHQGQSVYIVAFRDTAPLVVAESGDSAAQPAKTHDLDLEKKVDEQLRKWGYFHIVDRPSEAEFIFLVYIDVSSIEGLAISPEYYQTHFKEKFDLDQLRDVAYARGTAGPLNIATLSRLTSRMVKQFREKVGAPAQ